jgi:hypothetical protein
VRDDRSNYVDAAAWSALVAGALLWCRRCRAGCPGHPVTADVVEQLLAIPELVEDVDAAPDHSSLTS